MRKDWSYTRKERKEKVWYKKMKRREERREKSQEVSRKGRYCLCGEKRVEKVGLKSGSYTKKKVRDIERVERR